MMPRFTAQQHVLAVLTVLMLSFAFHGLFLLNDSPAKATASASSFGAGYTTILLPLSAR